MTKKILIGLLAVVFMMALWGCEQQAEPPATAETTVAATTPPPVPADGNPDDVTCKGTYTADGDKDAVVATLGDAELTNGQLWAWYWAEVAQYRQEQHDVSPDFSMALDAQPCEIDGSVNSWQQYFLKQALSRWHGAQALAKQGQEDGTPIEEAYNPNYANLEKYMTGMPVTDILYGFNDTYSPNSMHQAFLDGIPEMLEEMAQEMGFADAEALAQAAAGTSAVDLAEFARVYNYGYMYFTTLGYYLEITDADVEAWFAENEDSYAEEGITRDSGNYVDIRHILLVPEAITEKDGTVTDPVTVAEDGTVSCSEAVWEKCQKEAQALLSRWQKKLKGSEANFADLANKNSDDSGTALDGGAYRQIRQGQLMEQMDAWCFDPARQAGDTTIIRTEYGCHILYYSGSTDIWFAQAEEDVTAQQKTELIRQAMERFPADIDYSAITLPEAEGSISMDDVLYPDIAHERYPEVPLYLQQDFLGTYFGGSELRTHGCGITTFSMLSSYMTDEEWTPADMCDRYGNYSYGQGTDGMIFINEPPVMGYYLREKTHEPQKAMAALEEGMLVVSIQHKGYWTSGGHYILFEKMTEDGMVQVRDSNIFNYAKLPQHKEDKHTWHNATYNGSGYWVFEKKVVSIPICSRCGTPESAQGNLLAEEYLCHKCSSATLRRDTWLNAITE